ncbi:SHOCT domain-containing protein [Companilactobacillus allii]|uniref:SHOCT domain-containing protein n=1 Tax=Companilactobacillus allii TaxID=1847728 RepID=A0A1P8Q4A7_9LACO|nr:SHOCT domain-containing protein [Companilactobacillus allii]APX72684.1 hypothetical protein BTM29_09030 [Companilactobacillus allii]USQ69789.1 SHOCT domain-containing protein [Companilactobacillus allii]
MSKQCVICDKKIKLWESSYQIENGNICNDCMPDVSMALEFSNPPKIMESLKLSKMNSEDIKSKLSYLKENPLKDEEIITDEISEKESDELDEQPDDVFDVNRAASADGLYADFTSKIVMTQLKFAFKTTEKLYYFKDITGYKPIVEGHEVKKHHGIARAATGGILFGGAGAIVGAMTGGKQYDVITKIAITVYLSSGETFGATFLSEEKKPDSWIARGAQQQLDSWCNILDRIISDNQSQPTQQVNNTEASSADEIRKYKELFDDGIISQEEFDKKKSELLNL